MNPLYGRVTVPVDGSTASRAALEVALTLVGAGGHVRCISVVDPTDVYRSAGVAAVDLRASLAALENDARRYISDAIARVYQAGIPCEGAIVHGLVEGAITVDVETGTDAVVMGTHGRSGVTGILLGSVAEAVLRRAAVPVVFAHETDLARRGPVVVAVDGSPASAVALDRSLDVARAWASPVVIVHVTGTQDPDDARTVPLQEAALRAHADGIDVILAHRHGDPTKAVLLAAADYDAALVIAGTRGRSAAERVVSGSVACRLVERARVPVLIVKDDASRRSSGVASQPTIVHARSGTAGK